MSNHKLHIVHTEASVGLGGQEMRIASEAEGMMMRGHRVEIIAPPEAPLCDEARRRNVPVMTLPIGRKNFKGWWTLNRWLAEHGSQVNIVNTHSSTDSWLTALQPRHPPILRTRHLSTPVGRGAATRWLYCRSAAHVVVTGEALRQQLHQNRGYPLDHITSVPTGIDTQHFSPAISRAQAQAQLPALIPLQEGEIVLGIVSTLRSWKGHEYLFEALSQGMNQPWRLIVVGDGPSAERFKNKAASLNLNARVHFVGHWTDVAPWLQAFDLFVLPSTGNEGVPQAILQAMSCGLPVISTHVGAVAEAVGENVTGLLVPPRDASALAHALKRMMADVGLREQMGKEGRRVALAKFSRQQMLDKMEALFLRFAQSAH